MNSVARRRTSNHNYPHDDFLMFSFFSKWPLMRQIRNRKDSTGLESMSEKTRAMHARIDGANVARSICPYCGVGCGQLIYHKDGKLISIEGDPESPISQGNLCPKGAASYQLLTHSRRETKMKYRAPRSKEWTEMSLERALDMNIVLAGLFGPAKY